MNSTTVFGGRAALHKQPGAIFELNLPEWSGRKTKAEMLDGLDELIIFLMAARVQVSATPDPTPDSSLFDAFDAAFEPNGTRPLPNLDEDVAADDDAPDMTDPDGSGVVSLTLTDTGRAVLAETRELPPLDAEIAAEFEAVELTPQGWVYAFRGQL